MEDFAHKTLTLYHLQDLVPPKLVVQDKLNIRILPKRMKQGSEEAYVPRLLSGAQWSDGFPPFGEQEGVSFNSFE